jgi:hypothetical protein
MPIDASIDALVAALAARGFPAPEQPASDADLRALEAEIAPMRVPADVRRWWERVDDETLPDLAFPALIGPREALDAWREVKRDFRSSQPLALVLVGYASWNCLSVELDTPDVPGGAVFRYGYDGGDFLLVDRCFADWVARFAAAVAAGHDEDAIEDALEAHVLEEREHPLYAWPKHWQRAAGLRPEDLEPPRGATTTLRDLLKTDPAAPATATLVARLEIDRVDGDGESDGVRVKVDDGTKKVVLTGEDRFVAWEVWGRWCAFEIDVSLTPGRRRRRDLAAITTIDAIRFAREL